MYYEYWGLTKAPFDNVPDPTMYVESHGSVENALAETLFAIEEGNECVAVIVGDVGSGKTMTLRLILEALDHGKYRIAFITNPDMSFVELMKEIIGQISGKVCEIERRIHLLERFNKLLFETQDEGKKVLIFIDEANAMAPADLESLRLLTNMQDDTTNLLTLILAGQMEFAKRLEHPRRANLFQRVGTYNRIEKIASAELVKDYVQTRIRLAGGKRMFFTDEAVGVLWEYSEHGVPRLINKICKLCMKAGETNGFDNIDAEVVTQVGERFQKLAKARPAKESPQKRRLKVDREKVWEEIAGEVQQSAVKLQEETISEAQPVAVASTDENIGEPEPAAVELPADNEERPVETQELSCETEIGSSRIVVHIPPHILEQARSCSKENILKLAGALAAEALQSHSPFAFPAVKDPVSLWNDIRTSIFDTLQREVEGSEEWQKGREVCRAVP